MSVGRRFHLIEKLGSGAFGTVYLAELESIEGFRKQVALKVLRPELGEGSDAGRRLRDEARLLGRLRHPNIVQVDDLVRLDGRYAVVMEYVAGHDLEVMLEVLGEPLPPMAALQICEAVARALASAFGGATTAGEPLKVVHRDIKPSNVRVTADGQVKVLDFGIARADFEEREARTERVRYGSIAYMAPERLLGEPETAAGDVYALMAVLYELILGEKFGRAELAPERFNERLEQAVSQLMEAARTSMEREAAYELGKLLRQGMTYDSEERPDAAQIALSLRGLQRRCEGEELEVWAARCVPRADALTAGTSEPAEGILSEQTMVARVAGDTLVPPPSEATEALLLDELSPEPEPEPPPPPPDNSARTMGLIAALVALVIAGVGYAVMAPGTDGAAVKPDPIEITENPSPEIKPVEVPVAEVTPEPGGAPEGSPEEGSPTAGGEAPPSVVEPETPPPVDARPVIKAPPAEAPPEATGEDGEATVAAPAGPRLRAVKFTVADASNVRAQCGDRDASGGSSALVRDLQAGECVVTATVGGVQGQTRFSVDKARGVSCTLEGTELTCR